MIVVRRDQQPGGGSGAGFRGLRYLPSESPWLIKVLPMVRTLFITFRGSLPAFLIAAEGPALWCHLTKENGAVRHPKASYCCIGHVGSFGAWKTLFHVPSVNVGNKCASQNDGRPSGYSAT